MAEYVYTPLDNPSSQIRLLTIPWHLNRYKPHRMYEPLTGRLSHYYIPVSDLTRTKRLFRNVKFPSFIALSYVWGDPTRSHEILIDGKRLLITANLHAALWRLHINSIVDLNIWADAICINQEDLAERSAQIQLMRQVYHLASSVEIWLGTATRESSRCMQFIACLTGSRQAIMSPFLAKEEKAHPNSPNSRQTVPFLKMALLVPAILFLGVTGRFLIGLSQRVYIAGDVLNDITEDSKKTLIQTKDASYQIPIENFSTWCPTTHCLKEARLKEGDFVEIAQLINRWLIQKPEWFRRMWVVQELGAASTVVLHCGRCSVTWTDFVRAVHYLHYTCASPVNDISQVTELEQIRSSWNRGSRPPLQDLIRQCRHRCSSDPRDKIYALLGLMGDPMNDFLQPDYSKSVSQVYANVTRHFITQRGSLNPICGQHTQGHQKELPSWVPDFELDQNLAPSPLVHVSGHENIFFASGRDERSKFSLPRTTTNHQPWPLLSAQGLLVGTVYSISVAVAREKVRRFDSPERRWHRTLVLASSLLGTTHETTNSLAEFSRELHKYVEFLNSEDPPPIQSTTSNEPFSRDLFSISNGDAATAYVQALLCGRFSPRERLYDNDVAIFRRPLEYLERLPAAFELGIRGRRLIITEAGHIGAAPVETHVSDLVCVLFGCSVPVILRPIPNEDMYSFIGECYMHGFMDGEALAGLETVTFEIRDFVLK